MNTQHYNEYIKSNDCEEEDENLVEIISMIEHYTNEINDWNGSNAADFVEFIYEREKLRSQIYDYSFPDLLYGNKNETIEDMDYKNIECVERNKNMGDLIDRIYITGKTLLPFDYRPICIDEDGFAGYIYEDWKSDLQYRSYSPNQISSFIVNEICREEDIDCEYEVDVKEGETYEEDLDILKQICDSYFNHNMDILDIIALIKLQTP